MSTEIRYTQGAKANPLGDIVARALAETGHWSVPAMRSPGFRMLEQALEQERALAEHMARTFRTLAPMPDKAQVMIDNAVVSVGLQRLSAAARVMAAGLTYTLTDPLSVTQLEWNTQSKVGAAQRTMTPSARGENSVPQMLPHRLPIYLTTDKFELDIRTLKASARVGQPLDTAIVGQKTRSVNEAIEDALINGPTTLDGQNLTDAGYTAYGLLNEPNVNTEALTLAAWVTSPVGSTVFTETERMISKLQGDKKFGPYEMFVGTTVGNAMDSDYNNTNNAQGLTIRERLLKIPTLREITVCDLMPSNKVVLVQMTSDVVEMVVGQQPTVIPWTSLDGFTIHNLVMAIMVPRVRSDYDGNSGVCVGTLA